MSAQPKRPPPCRCEAWPFPHRADRKCEEIKAERESEEMTVSEWLTYAHANNLCVNGI